MPATTGGWRVRERDQVGAVVERDLRPGGDQRRDAVGVGGGVLAVAGMDLGALGDERGRDLVLRRERVGRAQAGARAAGDQRADEVGGLARDVQAGRDTQPLERPRLPRSARGSSAGPASGRRPSRSGPRRRPPGPDRRCPSAERPSPDRPRAGGRRASSGTGRSCTGRRRDADVGRLLGGERGQPHAERVEVQPRDLLVEVLGQHVDLLLVVVVLREQLDLGDRLVRERVRHHEARVPGRVAEVQQPALGEDDDRVAVGEAPLVDLRLDVDRARCPAMRPRPAMSISLSKWPMLPTIAWCFMRAMWSAVMTSLLPVAVMKMSAVSTTSSSVRDLVALHRGLQRADRVDLGDDDAGALAAQRLRAALADVAVAAHHRDLAADHHVGRAVDAVDQRVPAAVEVVELRLRHGVVDVDGREAQRAGWPASGRAGGRRSWSPR